MKQIIDEARQILQPIVDNIPDHIIFDIDRCRCLFDELQKLDREQRITLRETIKTLLSHMEELEASDIDMGGEGSHGKIWYRVHGSKRPEESLGTFDLSILDLLIVNLLEDKQVEVLLDQRSYDFSFVLDTAGENTRRLRATIYLDLGHLALNMRMIPKDIRSIQSYDFHKNVINAFSLERSKSGLNLVTGITGSGKSTTLDSIVDFNNSISDSHITIIGDPIERVHKSKMSIVRHREIGTDVLSFKDGAIQALRQDPDIIIIGEMRSSDTIMTTLELADTGHKVFSTVHTSSAVETIDRIVDTVPYKYRGRVKTRLADVLDAIVSQKLMPGTEGKLVLAKEVMLMTPAIKAAIKNENTDEIYGIMRQGSKYGMKTLEQDLKRLYRRNEISFEIAISNANNKKHFKELVKYSF
ncbi:MAG TPA: ATPase, T2SS/T4P/T4SS family [bacterium]|nr:ATPase, T2SS/T4P/T4SS family [bacterium]